MAGNRNMWQVCAILLMCVANVLCSGCHSAPWCQSCGSNSCGVPDVPRELNKTTMPEYMIEAPDILMIDATRVVPLPPYRIQPFDTLAIIVTETLPQQPIQGIYSVEPDGTVSLGFSYGSVSVVDATVEEAKAKIETYLKQILKPGFQVSVSLSEIRAKQQITGPHLVRQDGQVNLGTYGCVTVAGMTLGAAKTAIEQHLSRYLYRPEIALDVAGYNSKVYYVITDNAGYGEAVYRFPVTGNETVLDALSQTYGLPPTASKKRIWLARPVPANTGCDQILPIDWCAITQHGQTETNYQVMPGDRIYVQSQTILTVDTTLGKFIAPIERLLGFTLLGNSTIRAVNGQNFGNNGGGF